MTADTDNDTFEDDLLYIMGDRKGRRLIWTLMARCGKGYHGFVAGQPDSTAFNLGQLNMVNIIEACCDPQLYVTMMQEAKENEENDDRSNDNTNT